MSQPNEGSNANALVEAFVKRKRGRPRKYPRQDPDNEDNASGQRGRSLNDGENSRVPRGFDGVNRSHPNQTNTVSSANFPMVGQEVQGAVEGVFDGGFLIGVRVENSATIFRGAVFIPGHYVPVSRENDVAPNLPMMRRNEVSSPLLRSVCNPCSRKRNRAANQGSANLVVTEGNQVDSVPQIGPPRIPKSNIVPVVLQPAKISNVVPLTKETSPVATQPAHLSAKAMPVLEADYPSNESTSGNQPPTHPQGSRQETLKVMQSESVQPLAERLGSDAESMKSPEVAKRVEAPSHFEEKSSNSASYLFVKGSGHYVEDHGDYKVQPLQMEPLHVRPSQNHSAISTETSKEGRPGKFNELLKVIREQTREHELSAKKTPTSRPKLSVVRSPENMAKEGKLQSGAI